MIDGNAEEFLNEVAKWRTRSTLTLVYTLTLALALVMILILVKIRSAWHVDGSSLELYE